MKQRYTHLGALLFLLIFALSCNKDAPVTEFYEGENFYYFSVEETSVLESFADQVALVVHYSNKEQSSGSASFSVDSDASTAVLDTDFTIVNTSSDLNFNADNGFSDTIYIQTIDNDEFTGGVLEITIGLENTQNGKAGFVGPANLRSSIKVLIQDDDCDTRNIAGDYVTATSGTSTDPCCPGVATVEGEVTITEISEGEYEIFDWSGGLYGFWYEGFGISPEFIAGGGLVGPLSVLCDDVSGELTEPFNTTTTITGKVDLASGVITYTWINGFDDTATVTLTPK
ncbi:MAG: hypothetical protein AAGA77_17000 [Bacteroidota bacterium]